MEEQESPIMGRPRISVDFNNEKDRNILENLCMIQCTLPEISGCFKVSDDTIERRVKEYYNETFAVISKRFQGGGKTSLRRAMYKKAVEDEDTKMMIHLSKHYLGMLDKVEQKVEHNVTPLFEIVEHEE